LTPDFGHGLQSQFPGILEPVFGDLFGIFAAPDLHPTDLPFQYLESLVIPPVPPHEEVKELIRILIDFLKLADSVKVLVDDFVCALQGNILDHGRLELVLCLGNGPVGDPKELSNLPLGFTISKHLIQLDSINFGLRHFTNSSQK